MLTRKSIWITVLIVLLSIFFLEILNTQQKHPDCGLNTTQLIEKYEYPVEVHQVVTEDGYVLTLHRIPHGRDKSQQNKIPILFMHGFSHSAIDFLYLGPGRSLALLLADKGYDIWLGNARGTTWSRKHTKLDPDKDPEFWDFSLHEIGVYDIAAFIDYILKTTNEYKLHFVGYSQGASTFCMLLSEKPQYAEKVRLMTALSPAVFLKDPLGPLWWLIVVLRKALETVLLDILKNYEVLPHDGLIASCLKHICNERSMFVGLCLHHRFVFHGYHREGINMTSLPQLSGNTPAGASARQMLHIVQLMDLSTFDQYDFGADENMRRYGQEKPPSYDLSKVTNPVAVYYSSNDWSVNVQNMEKLWKILPNVVKMYRVPLEKFNHGDFVHGVHATRLLYGSVIEEILKY